MPKKMIYAEDLLAAVRDDPSINGANFRKVKQHIEEAPDAVKRGHWCWEGRFKACSQCGSYVEWDETLGANFWKFCPYCGTRMDGEEDG